MTLLERIRQNLADYRLRPRLPWGLLLDPRKRTPAYIEEWERIRREQAARRRK